MNLKQQIQNIATKIEPELIVIRRHLHQYPELSFKEFKTSKFIAEQLSKKNISFQSGIVNTGIIVIIEGKNPTKKCVLLRADIDALPIEEENNVPYKSCNKGVMHACGHDVHTTCVLGAIFILNELKNNFEGTIKIIFQPGEETLPGGASLMINEGILENPKVDKAIALHVFPSLEAGKAGFCEGKYMASTDELYITVNGKAGHAAMPADYVNPIIIASELITTINNTFMVNEQAHKTVVAIGKIEAKGATNVIPQKVELAGTIRTMDEDWRSAIHQKLHLIVKAIGEKYGYMPNLKVVKGYPVLVNNSTLTKQCKSIAIDLLGENNAIDIPQRMTAEDFAFISQKIPSCFFRLGTANQAQNITSGVHTPTFNVDEKAIKVGAELLTLMAITVI
ncbi:MAG: amidohydrolase [Bacteroidetes bacterium]|nr:amidohydrolase [Bacteroidota bacterium]